MKRPAIFFDRDNTLIVSDGYLGDASGVNLIPGAADAIARARRLGYATVVVSNQSGVARGMFGEEAVHAVNARLDELLRKENPAAIIDRHEFCPYHPQAVVEQYRQDSDLRKPKPGMILRAAEKLALDLQRSWLIGDAPRDIEAGQAAGCRTIFFVDPSLPASPAAADQSDVQPDFTCATLVEAIDYIERHPLQSDEEDNVTLGSPGEASRTLTEQAQRAHQRHAHEQRASDAPDDAAPLPIADLSGVEARLDQILGELRKHRQDTGDFSVSKLMAGIVQVVVLAVLFVAYLNRNDASLISTLLLAIVLQTLTIALLIMGRQK